MKKESLLECLFQKRVKHQKWHLGNSIPLPSLTYISSYIPTGAILFLVPLSSDFICTFVTPCYSPYPYKKHSHKSHHSPFTYKLGQFTWIVFLLGSIFYTTFIFFWIKLFIPSKLKAHIANPTHQNWDT